MFWRGENHCVRTSILHFLFLILGYNLSNIYMETWPISRLTAAASGVWGTVAHSTVCNGQIYSSSLVWAWLHLHIGQQLLMLALKPIILSMKTAAVKPCQSQVMRWRLVPMKNGVIKVRALRRVTILINKFFSCIHLQVEWQDYSRLSEIWWSGCWRWSSEKKGVCHHVFFVR